MARHLPTYRCRRAGLAGEPTARIDVPPWSQAEWITQFHAMGTGQPLPSERTLSAALLWDDAALHVAWRSAPSLIPVTRTQRDEDLWTECAVELFLAAGTGYYEFEINPQGAVLDLHFPDEVEQDWRRCARWDAEGLRWAVRAPAAGDAGDEWVAQMRIPWAALPELSRDPGKEGEVELRMQVSRSCHDAGDNAELSVWGPARGAFCERAGMGRLLLVD